MTDRTSLRAPRPAKPHLSLELRVLYLLIVAAFIVQVGWTIGGGMLLRENGTAMCPEVCVGSLIIDRPLAPHTEVHKGETVTFVAPGTSTLSTRRVAAVFADGRFVTSADSTHARSPLVLTSSNVKGVTVATVWGLGWLGSALPFLALGVALIVLVRRSIDLNVRRAFDRLFFIVLFGVPLWLLNPFFRSVVLMAKLVGGRFGEHLVVVNTSLLPAQFTVAHGSFKDFVAPSSQVVLSGPRLTDGVLSFTQFLSLHWWGWASVLAVLLIPLGLLVGEVAAAQNRSSWDRRMSLRSRERLVTFSAPVARETPTTVFAEPLPVWTGSDAERRTSERRSMTLSDRDALFVHNDVANNFEHYVELSPRVKKKKKNKTTKSKKEKTKGE
jgi:hypothetical protein